MQFSGVAYEEWSEVYCAHRGLVQGAVLSFLKARAAERPVAKVKFSRGRGHAFSEAWNSLAGGDFDSNWGDTLAHPFVSAFMTSVGRGADAAADYLQVCAQADAGNFGWFDLDTRTKCMVTGETLTVEFHNWVPSLGVLNHKNRDAPFTPLQGELPPPVVAHNVIDVPSGELLIADWIRIDAFTKLVDARKDVDGLASDAGRMRRTQDYADMFGFMSVSVSNTSPRILQRDGQIVFAHVDEDVPGVVGEVVGYVCTDLWAVTAIDHQVLTKLLADAMGLESAEREVAAAIAGTRSNEVVRVNVRPGKLHIYNTGKEYGMSEFTCPEVDVVGVPQVFAVLSERELTWESKVKPPAPARRARMR
jgi:hypothetical protein